jgi:hypothetical protein
MPPGTQLFTSAVPPGYPPGLPMSLNESTSENDDGRVQAASARNGQLLGNNTTVSPNAPWTSPNASSHQHAVQSGNDINPLASSRTTSPNSGTGCHEQPHSGHSNRSKSLSTSSDRAVPALSKSHYHSALVILTVLNRCGPLCAIFAISNTIRLVVRTS